jgi:hypothetical protein
MNTSVKTRLAEFGYKALVMALLGLWLVYPPQKNVSPIPATAVVAHEAKP